MDSYRIGAGRIFLLSLLCLASTFFVVSCSLPWQHHTASKFAKPTTQQILSTVQKKFRTVTSFHVIMQVQNEGPALPNHIQIRSANGDVVMPDKVKAAANIVLSGQAVAVSLISVGGNQYVTDPITGQYRVIKGVLDPRSLTNPDTGLISLAGKIEHTSDPSDDTVNGTPCWRVTGLLDAKYIAFFTGGGVPQGTMLQTSICVGKADALAYQVKVIGQAALGDTSSTIRSFDISNYNEHVTITAPQI